MIILVNPPRNRCSGAEVFTRIIDSALSIKFTTEEPSHDGSMPFLDTLVTAQEDGTLTTCVYKKTTHTELYLQWDNYHNLACKYSVIKTLTHGANAVCSKSELLKKELKHRQEVLSQCKYPKWAIEKIPTTRRQRQKIEENRTATPAKQRRVHLVVPYSQGLCEKYKNICGRYGVQVHFKGGNTLQNQLMFPKDREVITKHSNIIY